MMRFPSAIVAIILSFLSFPTSSHCFIFRRHSTYSTIATSRSRGTNNNQNRCGPCLVASSSSSKKLGLSSSSSESNDKNDIKLIKVLAVFGLRKLEWRYVAQVLYLCAPQFSLWLDDDAISVEPVKPLTGISVSDYNGGAAETTYHGNTGRVIILQHDSAVSQETMDRFVAEVKQELNSILVLDADFQELFGGFYQPVYLHTQTGDKVVKGDVVKAILTKARKRGLFNRPFPQADASVDDGSRFVPSQVVRINQHIFDEQPDPVEFTRQGAIQEERGLGVLPFPDWGTIAIYDDLVTADLRERLLKVVLGDSDWDDTTKGPDPNRWTRNGVIDYPGVPNNNWGMAGMNLVEILVGKHPAIDEMEALIGSLFREYTVERTPLIDFEATPININAPTRHETCNLHCDANPLMTPLEPMFSDLFGKYNNRCSTRPVFVSVLVYLMKEWEDAWGAPTSFQKYHQEMVTRPTSLRVQAKPGRVVVMHSDIWHSVNPPTDAAGERPRYSMVWRLILYPKTPDQPTNSLQCGYEWPEATEILR